MILYKVLLIRYRLLWVLLKSFLPLFSKLSMVVFLQCLTSWIYLSLIGTYCLFTPSCTVKVADSQSSGAYSRSFSMINPRYLICLSDWLSFWIYFCSLEVGLSLLGIISDEALLLVPSWFELCYFKLWTYLTGSYLVWVTEHLLILSSLLEVRFVLIWRLLS